MNCSGHLESEWPTENATIHQTHVLDVELEVLRVTEGGFQRLHGEIGGALVGETHEELHNLISRKLCGDMF